ncbi:S24 family peptidase [Moraxella catarrhalis]|uniref:S24 family peptidase n=1 Tax=Moraxella catarrhalis TaxID=480 RepID=UPI0001D2628E|nr:S24 family peptidase [Moraxella catarrhalis]ADG61203.1 peptidase S24-like protein [Moraxella catarrhalis BBH18]AXT94911.1 peptidase S24 [Moraxella catarrhalis]MPW75735.1 peptidase S24 [Moraxella catarrhalis]RKM04750.1 helix-turn-helix transcriptional regulator [Moraxella catarrhalis]
MTPEIRLKNLTLVLEKIEKEKGLNSFAKIAKEYDLNASYLSQLMNGNRQIGERSARSLEKKLKLEKFSLDNCPLQSNINPDFESITEWDNGAPLDDDEAEIPFYKDIAFACGHGAVNGDAPLEGRKLRMGRRTLSNLGVMPINAYAVTACDDSMTPYVQDGDTIYIDKGRKEVKDGRIFAIRFGELCLCKRLYRLPDGGVRIVSDNAAEFPEQVATKQQISDGEFEVIGWVWSVSRLERW